MYMPYDTLVNRSTATECASVLTGLSPNSKSMRSSEVKFCNASSVSPDMRTIMACFGFVLMPSPGREWPCKDSDPLLGSGMVSGCHRSLDKSRLYTKHNSDGGCVSRQAKPACTERQLGDEELRRWSSRC